MPQRKYYCDYCDRSFVDSKEKREMHFQSIQHKNNVQMWFQSKRETAELMKQSTSIPICADFKVNGFCQRGNTCPMKHILITEDKLMHSTVIPLGLLDSAARQLNEDNWVPVDSVTRKFNQLPQADDIPHGFRETLLPLHVDLPPSLLPVHISIYQNTTPCDWG